MENIEPLKEQEVEFIVKLKLSLPIANHAGQTYDESEYCQGLYDTLHVALKNILGESTNSADVIDIMECRQEQAIYRPTIEQAYNYYDASLVESKTRLQELFSTLFVEKEQ